MSNESKRKDGKTGQVEIVLRTGFSRGNDRYVAGDKAFVGPGLARRLVEQGKALTAADEAARVAKKAAAARAEIVALAEDGKTDADEAEAGKAEITAPNPPQAPEGDNKASDEKVKPSGKSNATDKT